MRTGFLLLLAALTGCQSPPGATRVPGEERLGTDPLLAGAAAAAELLQVEALDYQGVRGARIAFTVPGDAAQITEMLLDFDEAGGHRSWAAQYSLLARTPDGAEARWAFRGRMGMNPTVEIAFRVAGGDPPTISYELTRPAFGMAAFFGDYRIHPDPAAPGRSILEERVFLDSGLSFANASAEDLAEGLREDARRIRLWMRERLGLSEPEAP